NPAESPILYLALSSTTLPIYTVDEAAESTFGQQLSMIAGVAQVQVFGASKYAVRIDADPNRMAALQVGINELSQAIQNANTNLPVGTIYAPDHTYTLQSNGQLSNAAQFRPVIVTYRNGAPVRLDQLANVTDSVENEYSKSWFNSQQAVILAIQKQPGTNTVEIVDSIYQMMPRLKQQIPSSITVTTLHDRSAD